MLGFKAFRNAAITIAGIELLQRIRKGQFKLGRLGIQGQAAPEVWNAVALEVSAAQKGRAFARDGYLHQSPPIYQRCSPSRPATTSQSKSAAPARSRTSLSPTMIFGIRSLASLTPLVSIAACGAPTGRGRSAF
jgi:hypothetical protein